MTQAVALAQQASTGVSQGFKNRIINGAMVIDQRNAGASVTVNGVDPIFTLDRYGAFDITDGAFTVQQVSTAPTGFVNSLQVTITTADTSLASNQYSGIYQAIEGFNTADLMWGTANAQTVTLSFWVRSSLTGTFGGSLRNSAGNRSYPFTYTISAANTWEQKSITIAGDTTGTWLTTNGTGIKLSFGLGVGTDFSGTANAWGTGNNITATGATSVIGTNGATWFLTGVQLEVGSTATSFDYRPYGTELQLCQRYLPAFTGANGATTGTVGTGGFFSTTDAAIGIPFPVTARVAPTGITVASAGYFQIDGLTSAACTSATFTNASQNMGGVNFGYATTTTSGSFARLRFNNALGTLLFTGCEL